jgi:hypothetical protein
MAAHKFEGRSEEILKDMNGYALGRVKKLILTASEPQSTFSFTVDKCDNSTVTYTDISALCEGLCHKTPHFLGSVN